MAQGLQIFNSKGNNIFDTTENTTYILGRARTGSSNGSLNVPALASGRPWILIVGSSDTSAQLYSAFAYPSFYISGTTIGWTFSDMNVKISCDFIYGWY